MLGDVASTTCPDPWVEVVHRNHRSARRRAEIAGRHRAESVGGTDTHRHPAGAIAIGHDAHGRAERDVSRVPRGELQAAKAEVAESERAK